MAPEHLVKEFPALRPQVVFSRESYPDIQNISAKPLNIIRLAAIALTEDLAMFHALGYHKTPTEASKEFLRSLLYYSTVLLHVPLAQMEREFQPYSYTPAFQPTVSTGSIGSKLADARQSLDDFFDLTKNVLEEAGWEFHWKAPLVGDMVPTASPYQLLYQMICTDKLSSVPADKLQQAFCKFHPLWLI